MLQNTSIQRSGKGRIQCTLSFTPEEVQQAEQAALKGFQSKISVKGFRKGQAPEKLVKEKIGKKELTNAVLQRLLPEKIPTLLQEEKIAPITHPRISVVKESPLTVEVLFLEHPKVKIKARKIAVEKKEPKVDDKEIQRVLDHMKKEHKQEKITDEFVKKTFQVENVAKLKEQIREHLTNQEKQMEQKRRENAFFEQVRTHTTVDLAPELIEEEQQLIAQRFMEQLKQYKMAFDQWLAHTQKSREDVEKEWKKQAENQIVVRYGVEKLIEEKKIEVSDEEMQIIVQQMMDSVPEDQKEQAKKTFEKGAHGYQELMWRKKMEKLMEKYVN